MNRWRRGMEVFSRGRPARFSALCAALLVLGGVAGAERVGAEVEHGRAGYFVLDLKRGEPAPAISATATDGSVVELADLRGRIVVALFAEAANERSQQATRHIARALTQEGVNGSPVSWLVLYTKGSDPAAIESETRAIRASVPNAVVIHDVQRKAFGDYHAVAMPSTVVIDGQGNVVHAMAGLSQRFPHTVGDAILLAAGKLTAEQFDLALNGAPEEPDEDQRRAERLAQMAKRLSERGQYDMAETHYLDALALAPGMTHARLGLADLLVRKHRLDEAETGFRSVLHAFPRSLEAAAGLALVHALRGDADQAEALARDVLERGPSRARAHYVLGLVHEQRNEHAKAAVSYRKATELLLDRVGLDDGANGESTPHP